MNKDLDRVTVPKFNPLDFNDMIKKSNEIPEKTNIQNPKNKKKFLMYTIPIALISSFVIIGIFLASIGIHIIFVLGFIVLTTPISFILIILFLARMFFDRHKISGVIIKNISKRYLKVRFHLPNKREIERYVLINDDGISFNIKNRRYIVDSDKIYYDEDRNPTINYIPNIPNGFKLYIEDYLRRFAKYFNEGKINEFKDKEGNTVDISFSSQNLEEFKRAKMFTDLQEKDKTSEKMVFFLLGILALSFVSMIIIVVVMTK